MKRCFNCDNECLDDAVVCPHCGCSLNASILEENTSNIENKLRKKKRKSRIILILIVLVVLTYKVFSFFNEPLATFVEQKNITALNFRLGFSKDLVDSTVQTYYLRQIENESLLEYCIENNCGMDIFNTLIDNGADINFKSTCGRTPFSIAIENKQTTYLKELINKGVNVNQEIVVKDFENYVPTTTNALEYCILLKDTNIALILIEAGANPNIETMVRYGSDDEFVSVHIPLLTYVAVLQNDKELVSVLVKAGADINKIDETGQTVLEWCINQNQDLEMIQLLVELGADVNHEDSYGKTALMFAMNNDSIIDIIKFLIDVTPDINKTNSKNLSALQFAVIKNVDIDIIKYLVYKGADCSIQTQYGTTLLDLSRKYASEDVTNYLELTLSISEFSKEHILDEAGVFTKEEKQKAAEAYYQFYNDFGIELVFITADSSVLSVDFENYSEATLDKYDLNPFPRILLVINPSNSYISWHTSTGLTNEETDILLDVIGYQFWTDAKLDALLSFESITREWIESLETDEITNQ